MLSNHFKNIILETIGATDLEIVEVVQELWRGYGRILRVALTGGTQDRLIVKHVQLPYVTDSIQIQEQSIGHQRKIKSYQVESNWYDQYSKASTARLPKCFAIEQHDGELLIVLEDLDAAGYDLRKQWLEWAEVDRCLEWLAQFHSSYLQREPEGLWPIGTYWHLDTRPEELARLTDVRLKEAAPLIDDLLNNCTYKTLVHGDAKVANFCFDEKGNVAGVDFQYVGGGCGMKDVAYFVGSCMSESDCARLEPQILDTYFGYLQSCLPEPNQALEIEWRSLYRVAWADFHRFMKGWSPNHWKINSYSEQITAQVIANL